MTDYGEGRILRVDLQDCRCFDAGFSKCSGADSDRRTQAPPTCRPGMEAVCRNILVAALLGIDRTLRKSRHLRRAVPQIHSQDAWQTP